MTLLDGKAYKNELEKYYKKTIEENNLDITLAIIQVGDIPESNIYIKNKINYCNKVGVKISLYKMESTTDEEIISLIDKLNKDDTVTGIILQSPTPGVDFNKCVEYIDVNKDVDGLTSGSKYLPCTVKGIIKLLKHYNIELKGTNVTILGRGKLVGKPLAIALTKEGCNVNVCHTQTDDITKYTKNSKIIVGAMGNPKYITLDMLSDGFIGIDAGTTFVDGKQVGDFDFDNVKDHAEYITPPVGGVGPMTVAMVVDNLIEMVNKK